MAQSEVKEEENKVKVPTITLSNEDKTQLPLIGFGLYNIAPADVETAVKEAWEAGYRSFDGASFYKNEKEFGAALKKLNIPRNEIFITSKVWNDMAGYEGTLKSFQQSLDDCQLEYFDLFLVHWPVPLKHIGTYKAVSELYTKGKVKAIGISNYTQSDYDELLKANVDNKAFIPPTLNQLNISPFYYDEAMIAYFNEKNIAIQAYKPLERGGESLLKHRVVLAMAQKYDMTAAQICLKWGIQHNFIELVKSVHKQRMVENISIFQCKDISADDMSALDALTTEETLQNWQKRYLDRKLKNWS